MVCASQETVDGREDVNWKHTPPPPPITLLSDCRDAVHSQCIVCCERTINYCTCIAITITTTNHKPQTTNPTDVQPAGHIRDSVAARKLACTPAFTMFSTGGHRRLMSTTARLSTAASPSSVRRHAAHCGHDCNGRGGLLMRRIVMIESAAMPLDHSQGFHHAWRQWSRQPCAVLVPPSARQSAQSAGRRQAGRHHHAA